MTKNLLQISTVFLFTTALLTNASGQTLACKPAALAALKPIPKLEYECDDDLTESEDAVLTAAKRRRAIDLYEKTLEKLTAAGWWQTDVEDLNVCDFRKKAGALTKKQKQRYEDGSFYPSVLGNKRYRVLIVKDPCYQTGFGGSNFFILNRTARGRIVASEIIDGFYTRSDYAPEVNYAVNGTEPIIEIATTSGGLYPTMTSYFFTIDKKSSRAVPKKMFKDFEGVMTNEITSQMLLGEPEEYGLPRRAEALKVIVSGRLSKSFDVFKDTGETFGEDDHQKFSKLTLRWNGKFYE